MTHTTTAFAVATLLVVSALIVGALRIGLRHDWSIADIRSAWLRVPVALILLPFAMTNATLITLVLTIALLVRHWLTVLCSTVLACHGESGWRCERTEVLRVRVQGNRIVATMGVDRLHGLGTFPPTSPDEFAKLVQGAFTTIAVEEGEKLHKAADAARFASFAIEGEQP